METVDRDPAQGARREGPSKREICRDYKVGWRTLEKILELTLSPPATARREGRGRSLRLGPYLGRDRRDPGHADPSTPRTSSATPRSGSSSASETSTTTGAASPRSWPHVAPLKRRHLPEVFVPSQPPAGASPSSTSARRPSRSRASADEGRTRGHDASLLGRLLRLGLPPRVHRDLPNRATSQRFEFFGGVPTLNATTTTPRSRSPRSWVTASAS